MSDDAIRLGPPGDHDDELPEHEYDEPNTVGGGMMSSGGTAVERGTDTLGGQAQGSDPDGDDEAADAIPSGIDEGGIIPGAPAGGASSYIPAAISSDEDEGGLPDA